MRGLLLPLGGILLVLFELARRRRRWWQGPHYVQQIQALKADKPLDLPAIQPLRAVPAKRSRLRKLRAVAPFARTGTK